MTRNSPTVPADTDILCEGCGYILNGLPNDSQCPECGKPIIESTAENLRRPPAWERDKGFDRTTLEVIFHPTRFYRMLPTRDFTPASYRFAKIHWIISACLFGLAAFGHVWWYFTMIGGRRSYGFMFVMPFIIPTTWFVLDGTTRLAAKLTTLEATYRGLRLPYAIVLRGLHYHAAHYLPVATIAAITVWIYLFLLSQEIATIASASIYLYVLSGEVILGAAYLFNTYWIAMRNMMYANK